MANDNVDVLPARGKETTLERLEINTKNGVNLWESIQYGAVVVQILLTHIDQLKNSIAIFDLEMYVQAPYQNI